MDHEMCLTCRFVGAVYWGDAILHRNRETFVHLKKVAKMSDFDHKSPSQGWAEGGWDGVLGRGGMGKEELVSEAGCRTLASDCGTSGDKA